MIESQLLRRVATLVVAEGWGCSTKPVLEALGEECGACKQPPLARCRAENSWRRREGRSFSPQPALQSHFNAPHLLEPNKPAGLEDIELYRVLDPAFESI